MGLRAEATRIAKFSAVGTIAFIVDFLAFNVLRLEALGLGPMWAKIISVALATTVSWLGSRYWTFRDRRGAAIGREALAFFLVNAGGLLIAMACLWVSHYGLGLRSALADNISANVVGVGLGNIFRYLMYRFVVYRVTPRRPPLRREVIDLGTGRPAGAQPPAPEADSPEQASGRQDPPVSGPPGQESTATG